MFEILFSISFGVVAAIVLILKENQKLRAKEKLNELDKKDNQLQAEQQIIQKNKQELKSELEELEKHQAPSLEDSQIENYWNKDKK